MVSGLPVCLCMFLIADSSLKASQAPMLMELDTFVREELLGAPKPSKDAEIAKDLDKLLEAYEANKEDFKALAKSTYTWLWATGTSEYGSLWKVVNTSITDCTQGVLREKVACAMKKAQADEKRIAERPSSLVELDNVIKTSFENVVPKPSTNKETQPILKGLIAAYDANKEAFKALAKSMEKIFLATKNAEFGNFWKKVHTYITDCLQGALSEKVTCALKKAQAEERGAAERSPDLKELDNFTGQSLSGVPKPSQEACLADLVAAYAANKEDFKMLAQWIWSPSTDNSDLWKKVQTRITRCTQGKLSEKITCAMRDVQAEENMRDR